MSELKPDPYDIDLGDEFDSFGSSQPNLAPDDQDWNNETYQETALPQGPFLIHDVDNDITDGPFDGRDFIRDEDTGAWYTQTEGRPFILRVIRQSEDEIWSVDGAGMIHHYTVLTPNVSGV